MVARLVEAESAMEDFARLTPEIADLLRLSADYRPVGSCWPILFADVVTNNTASCRLLGSTHSRHSRHSRRLDKLFDQAECSLVQICLTRLSAVGTLIFSKTPLETLPTHIFEAT